MNKASNTNYNHVLTQTLGPYMAHQTIEFGRYIYKSTKPKYDGLMFAQFLSVALSLNRLLIYWSMENLTIVIIILVKCLKLMERYCTFGIIRHRRNLLKQRHLWNVKFNITLDVAVILVVRHRGIVVVFCS